MRKVLCLALSMSLLLVVCGTTPGSSLWQGSASMPMTDREAAATVGGGPWGDFFSGVSCGIGIGLLISGYASGLGAPGAALLTASTLRMCASALGL
jgi:hypothetical protein